MQKELEEALKDATDALARAAADLENSENSERNIRESYMSGIKGYIAKELKEGVPCPVCGNVHHPKPAAIPEGCAEAKDVEKAEKEFEKDTRVHIATVQSLVKRILYNESDVALGVSDYDCIIVDEAHRGYILDKEMGDVFGG